MINKLLGNRYEILEKIGEGGMAYVYKAKCRILNRIVAIKMLKPEFGKDEEFIEKFKNEAQSAASLNQQNIINIFDVGQDEDISYIVMEFVDGQNLKDEIHKKGAIEQETMVSISRQIAMALEEAHSKKIVHRDIKSQNIMLAKNNMVKVADFGIAKAVSSSTITAVGSIMGSVHYFSPEQARGGYVDERSDVYSLGIVMYEMITGKLPFEGDSPVNIALKHIQEEITFSDNDNISAEIKDVIRKATQKSADRRYKTVSDLIRDLDYIKENKAFENNFSDETYHTQKIVPDDQYKILFTDVSDKNEIKKSEESSKVKKSQKKSDIKSEKKDSKKLIMTVTGALLAALVFVGIIFMINGGFGQNTDKDKIETPEFTGKTFEEAKESALENGVEISIAGEEVNNIYEPGLIAKQDPEAGTKIMKGETIEVIISAQRKEEVVVPELTGKKIEEASKLISDAKLEESVEYKFDQAEENIVIEQTPRAGDKIEAGQTVKITVSMGKEENNIELPTVLGKSEQEARNILKNFNLKVSYREDKGQSEGIVLSQNPSPGQKMSTGSEVGIVVNRYEKPKEVSYAMVITLPKDKENVRVQIKDVTKDTFIYDKTVKPIDLGEVLEVEVKGLPGELREYYVYLDGDYNNLYANPKVQF
ncbi:Stk1 family PASTA domain-containing Ser/Thr kinase [Proteocatella sphenisci]|uniref:Stk1 family PASTA domain-containing Ser/Thr kinase n=1 Tax=Proteocatella sphenisci TaxID=181070 RepID=UPI00048F4F57|nr:Stk1 family PASTA domain-containing Ser/Thr kinase [Proteocatella sphenisci]